MNLGRRTFYVPTTNPPESFDFEHQSVKYSVKMGMPIHSRLADVVSEVMLWRPYDYLFKCVDGGNHFVIVCFDVQ